MRQLQSHRACGQDQRNRHPVMEPKPIATRTEQHPHRIPTSQPHEKTEIRNFQCC